MIALKKAFCKVETLGYPEFQKHFIVDTDASDYGIDAVLSQRNQFNVKQPVSYYSRASLKPKRRYEVTR